MYLVADANLNTLLNYRFQKEFEAIIADDPNVVLDDSVAPRFDPAFRAPA